MKPMGLLPILLLLGVGITSVVTDGQISAYQTPVQSNVPVGQTIDVTLQITNVGSNATQAQVIAVLPDGLATPSQSIWAGMLPPGDQQVIRYPVVATRSGDYTVVSQISYMDEIGRESYLSMESSLSATGGSNPGELSPGPYPSGPGGYNEDQGGIRPMVGGPRDYGNSGAPGYSEGSLSDPGSGVQDNSQSSLVDQGSDIFRRSGRGLGSHHGSGVQDNSQSSLSDQGSGVQYNMGYGSNAGV